jgi:CheY-like chemotaxis protein
LERNTKTLTGLITDLVDISKITAGTLTLDFEEADLKQVVSSGITASVRNEDRARSQQAGFQAHLAKPVNPNELVTTIIELVGQKARNE